MPLRAASSWARSPRGKARGAAACAARRPGFVVSPVGVAELEERGFEGRTVPGAGHTIDRDDFEYLMTPPDGWI
ncbi:hypothetical protein ACFO9E_34000 [Streptomyces maoxianensis]|uniref:Uncharacterized protein n=1 Tax=Streptomyces maoxianensis TaxID=1459942 RepID=A0ABV9GFH6_9ACTN